MTDETATVVQVRYCVPDDQEQFLPGRRRHPHPLPGNVPLPRVGELIYLSSSSAWAVASVVHEWRSPTELLVQLWLEHVGSSRQARAPGFTVTQ
jgi:hypothetical protein